ncbi:transporter [Shewanella submarina]|uniref:Transporter n=1 Tax=Shewanella submarina TaxID=2016376 RepID=A0ABV7GM11_9GAMM|nr:transporter [Shewanella submarina]MCL1035813.1 transporter [Shewanella submarina]
MKKGVLPTILLLSLGSTSAAWANDAPVARAATPQEEEALRQEITRLKRQLLMMNQQMQQQQKALNNMAQRVLNSEQVLNKGRPQQRTNKQAEQQIARQPVQQAPAKVTTQTAVDKTGAGTQVADTKKAPDRSRSTEDVLQETHTVFSRKFSIEPSLSYSYFSRKDLILRGFLALDAIFLGNLNLDRIRTSNVQLDLTTRYSFNENWQIDLSVPYIYRENQFDSVGEGNSSQRYEVARVDDALLGDVSAGIYYRIMAETQDAPDWVWNLRVKAPTGKDPYGIELLTSESGNLTYPSEMASGNGVWGVSTGFSLAKTYDPAIVFFNLNYGVNLPQEFDDITGQAGIVPGEIDLGDYIDYSVGLAFAVSERMSLGMSFNQRFFSKTKQRVEGGPWESIPRSDTNTATLGLGATLALTDSLSMVTSIGAGLTEDTPDYQISLRFPYRF